MDVVITPLNNVQRDTAIAQLLARMSNLEQPQQDEALEARVALLESELAALRAALNPGV